MQEKNKKMLLLVGVLLLVGGVSFAYFVGKTVFGGNGANVSGTTATINGATLNVEGNLSFNDLDILPGHQTVSSIKVTATGNNETVLYNLIWNGTNSLNTPLNYKVYKTTERKEVTATCEKKTKIENGAQILNEECTISNLESLGDVVSSGIINKNTETTKEILVSNEYIEATSEGNEVYYYVILEYPNLEQNQNEDLNGTFNGTVTVEGSNTKADINIVKVYIEQNDGSYKETTSIPKKEELLVFNSEKSSCTNSATPSWNNDKWSLKVNNLTTSGTDCNLYFKRGAGSNILGNVTVNEETPDFNKTVCDINTNCYDKTNCSTSCGDSLSGLFKAKDDIGISYYFRGAVTNNYIKFANKYWRIIRINGDGSIRVIYDGETIRANGTALSLEKERFNSAFTNNMYVGFRYTNGQVHGTGTKSSILGTLESWYNNNLASYASKLDMNAGFCGDRTPSTSETEINNQGGTGTTLTYYGGYIRLVNSTKSPSLSCLTDDYYTVSEASKGNNSLNYPIGLITADEVSMAGGVYNGYNFGYYLYVDQAYWTMTPWSVNGTSSNMFIVGSRSSLEHNTVVNSGVRPVINLRSDIELTGTGTSTDPYVVVGANS